MPSTDHGSQPSNWGARYAYVTHRGLVRARNEDALSAAGRIVQDSMERPQAGALPPGAPELFLVADGLGGHDEGALASRFVVEEVARRAGEITDAATIAAVLNTVDAALKRESAARRQARPMGTTLVGCILRPEEALVFAIGDSPAYEIGGGLRCLTAPDRLPDGPANLVTQCLGGGGRRQRLAPHLCRLARRPGLKILLCSDGLSDYVPEAEIADHAAAPPHKAAARLLDAALAAGAPDNVTLILVELGTAPA